MGDVFDALVRSGQRQAKPLPGTRSTGGASLPEEHDADGSVEPATGALPWAAAADAAARDPQGMGVPLSLSSASDAMFSQSEPPPPPPITRAHVPPVVIPRDLEVPRLRARSAAVASEHAPAPTDSSAPSAADIARQQMLLEQYRQVRDALIQRGTERDWRLHLFTCVTPRDGRAATVYNLGQTFSERGELRVLLIEADMRSPSFHRLFQKPFTPGLAQLLRGQLQRPEQAVHKTRFDNVDVLPAGDCEFSANRDMLSGQAMLTLLQELKGRYDHVLVDAPPAPMDDGASELATFADETLLVVKMRSTPAEQVESTKRLLRLAGVTVSGVIVSHG